jgi:hypothetical protein
MVQVSQNSSIAQTDHFSDAFQRFQDSRQFKRLQDKYKVKPYFERQRALKVTSAVSGYVLNAFSASTAFLFVYTFLNTLLPAKGLSGAFTLVFLFALEALKRLTLPGVFKTYLQFKKVSWGAVLFAGLLSSGSIASSYFGAKEAVKLLTPDADLANIDDVRKPFEARLEVLQADKADAMKQTWKGKQTVQSAKRLNVIQLQEAEIQSAMLKAIQEATEANNKAVSSHTTSTTLKAGHFAGVTLVFELLLLLCLYFGELYDFRSLAEFSAHKATDVQETQTKTVPAIHTKQNGRPVIAGFQTNAMRYTNINAQTQCCQHCGNAYEKKTSWQKFCSTECRLNAHAARHSGRRYDVTKHNYKQNVVL